MMECHVGPSHSIQFPCFRPPDQSSPKAHHCHAKLGSPGCGILCPNVPNQLQTKEPFHCVFLSTFRPLPNIFGGIWNLVVREHRKHDVLDHKSTRRSSEQVHAALSIEWDGIHHRKGSAY